MTLDAPIDLQPMLRNNDDMPVDVVVITKKSKIQKGLAKMVMVAIFVIITIMIVQQVQTASNNALQNNNSNQVGKNSNLFGGINSWFIYAQDSVTRNNIYTQCKNSGLKTIRVFVTSVQHGLNNIIVNDVEVGSGFDDQILLLIDQTMLEASLYGLKLIIVLHDRWRLGSDVYNSAYGVSNSADQMMAYYTDRNGTIQQRFDKRLTHILTHRNMLMGGRTWGNISEAVFAIEAENEAMASVNIDTVSAGIWHCDRAKVIKNHIPVRSKVLVSTGGGQSMTDSSYNDLFTCPQIDLVALHSTDHAGDPTGCMNAVQLAVDNGKRTFVEKFSCDIVADGLGNSTWRAACIDEEIQKFQVAGLPWMYWSVDGVSDGGSGIWTDDPGWGVLESHVAGKIQSAFSWPEIN